MTDKQTAIVDRLGETNIPIMNSVALAIANTEIWDNDFFKAYRDGMVQAICLLGMITEEERDILRGEKA